LIAPSTERAWVQVDLDALAWNTARVREFLPAAPRLMAVVKADAYGHGAESVSRTALEYGAASLGVATVDEGVALREAGVEAPILVLGHVSSVRSVRRLIESGLTPTVCSASHAMGIADALTTARGASESRLRRGLPVPVHAKIDTGMSRLGCPFQETAEFARTLHRLRGVLRVDGLYSHLACADSVDPASMNAQRTRFERARRTVEQHGVRPRMVHLGNSAACLTSTEFCYDLVRVGLALYGLSPAPHLDGRLPLRPALEVKARVTQVRRLAAGAAVSYGETWTAPRDRRVATVGIGFADGVPWTLSNRMQALVRGRRVRQIGRVTMDQLILDVTDVPGVETGDEVTVIGRDGDEAITARDWAEILGTITWEVLCSFKSRLPRVATSLPRSAVDRAAGAPWSATTRGGEPLSVPQ